MSSGRTAWLVALGVVVLAAARGPAAAPPPARVDAHGDPLPPGAAARLGTVRWRHDLRAGGGFARVAFSPDAKVLASTGAAGLRLWDVSTGKLVGWQPPGSGAATAATFTPGGKTLITESAVEAVGAAGGVFTADRLLQHWQVGTGRLVGQAVVKRDGRLPRFTTFSRDGRLLLTAGDDGVALWDPSSGRQRLRVEAVVHHWDPFDLSPDGRTLAVITSQDGLHLYDVARGTLLRKIPVEDYVTYAPCFSPDGKTLVASGQASLYFWDVATGKLRHELKGCRGPVAFTRDGKQLACGDRQAVRLWDAAALKEVRAFEAHDDGFGLLSLAFSADGKLLASGGRHAVGVWDVATGKRRNYLPAHQGPVRALAFSPDGRRLASGGEDGVAFVWDVQARAAVHRLRGHFPAVAGLAFSPDGKTLATGDGLSRLLGAAWLEAQVRLWDLKGGRLLRQFHGHLHSVDSLAFSPDGRTLASGGGDARVRLWEVASGKRLRQIRGADGARSVAFSPDGKGLLVRVSSTELGLWDVKTGKLRLPFGDQDDGRRGLAAAAWLAGGTRVLSAERAGLRFWDASSGRQLRAVKAPASPSGVDAYALSYALSPDGSLYARSGLPGRDPLVELWDADAGKLLAQFRGHRGSVTALAFSPDGNTLATGSHDTTVLLWDVFQARLDYYWSELRAGRVDARALAVTGGKGVAFLKDSLTRAAAAEARVRRLAPGLDDDDFEARQRATRQLEGLGPQAEFGLRILLEETPSLEVRMRVLRILKGMKKDSAGPMPLDRPRLRAALELLAKLGTPESRRAVEEVAGSAAGTVVTREAQAALKRVNKGKKTP